MRVIILTYTEKSYHSMMKQKDYDNRQKIIRLYEVHVMLKKEMHTVFTKLYHN